tara:strand:- start:160 stop:942 length:783 start_codon:yes stop_codon:yes gene_type:complete
MKKILRILILTLIFSGPTSAGEKWGEGELQLTDGVVNYFIKFIRGKGNKRPADFYVATDGTDAIYWYCSEGSCREGSASTDIKVCEQSTGKKCRKFAFRRTIKWKNGINPAKGKASTINSKWSDSEIRAKLTELGFYKNTKKVEKKKETKKKPKITKKYEAKGERSIALSWDGYENLIAGTVEFDEKDYKGILTLPLPNNDGTCDGTYSLQEGGKGTWQIACTNNMGAAGTLKWTKDGSVTGTGRDHNDKKVKFTVSKQS